MAGEEKAKAAPSIFEAREDLVKRLERDLKKGAFQLLTPFTLAQQYGLKISTAKKVLRAAEARGLLKRISHTRRTIVYVPQQERQAK